MLVNNRVIVNNYASEFKKITSGFPQGSILGCLLSIVFIIDLPECCTKSHVLRSADDTKITRNRTYELQIDSTT